MENIEEYSFENSDTPNVWGILIALLLGAALSFHFISTFRSHLHSAPQRQAAQASLPVSSQGAADSGGALTATFFPDVFFTSTPTPAPEQAFTPTASLTPLVPGTRGEDSDILYLPTMESEKRHPGSLLNAVLNPPTATPLPSATPTFTPTPTATPLPGTRRISPINQMAEVYIPGGSFLMGRPAGDEGLEHDQPIHGVELDAYWMDQFQVTNAAYASCVADGACSAPCSPDTNPHYYDTNYAGHPVVYVTWQQAEEYCSWSDGHLPSEAEWERAAGGGYRIYPWAGEDPGENFANLGGVNESTVPVGSYPDGASPWGALDMGGNVREWVRDWYSPSYYSYSPASNPTGPDEGTEKVLRGASWNDPWYYAKITRRYAHDPNSAGENRGFRCAYDR